MPRRPLPKVRMLARRAWFWFGGYSWWAVLALITGIFSVIIAFTEKGLVQVVAVAGLSITLAILSTKEEPSP